MAVHGGFGGKPRPPGPGVEQYRHEHKGGQGSRGIAHQCAEDIAAHPIALAQGKVAKDGHQAKEHDEVQAGPLHAQGKTKADACEEAPPAESKARAKGGRAHPVLHKRVVEALAHLIMIAGERPGGGYNEKDLEYIQHAELGGDQEHAIKDGDETG